MSSFKQLKLEQKVAGRQQEVISELNSLVKDVERCENTITSLKNELAAINSKHQGRKTTREDIAYLTDLLECAKKKLTLEKHIASLQKRTPEVLRKMVNLMTDATNPPAEQTRAEMMRALQSVQAAMERLQNVKTE